MNELMGKKDSMGELEEGSKVMGEEGSMGKGMLGNLMDKDLTDDGSGA